MMEYGMQTQTLRALSPREYDDFRREGYYIARGLLSCPETAAIREAFMAQAANGPVPGLSDAPQRGVPAPASDPLARYPRMMHPHHHPELPVGQIARRYLLDARIGARLWDLLGDEPVAVQSMFYFKPPGARGQDLHQDNYYLRVAPQTCMAAWIAIDDADPENGGMNLVPGTQDLPVLCPGRADPALFFTTDHLDLPPGKKEVPAILQAGDVLFFNGSVIHGSYPNRSAGRFRRALINHYVPLSCRELAKWYQSPLRFDGSVVRIPEAAGGGPCGTSMAPASPH